MVRKKENSSNKRRVNHAVINSKNASNAELHFEKHDIELLREYGFNFHHMSSVSRNKKKISKMGMRQLDRTKMLILRNSNLCGGFPKELQTGITKNNLNAFSEALALLSDFIFEN